MAVTIRTATFDEAEAYARASSTGFLNAEPLSEESLARRRLRWQPGRWWVADDDGRFVGTLRTVTQHTTLPGGRPIVTAGLTTVTVTSTHRRRGLMAQMLRSELDAAVERGEPLTTLIAAEWPIYGRFGYGPAIEHATYTIDVSSTRWLTQGTGNVELCDPATLCAVGPQVYEAHRRASPGEIDRDTIQWELAAGVQASDKGPWKGFQALCRDDGGQLTGYVRYQIDSAFDGRRPNGTIDVVELIAVDPSAQARLWRHLTETDWIRTVKAEDRSVSETLPFWLADGRAARQTERADFVWARPLDVSTCLTTRTYATSGRVVIDVVDPLGYCSGRYLLDASPDGSTCRRTDATADLTLSVATLGALLFGDAQLLVRAAAGLVDEHRPGATAGAEALFHWPVAPWSVNWF